MLTDKPEWSAGYTTKINHDLTEDFTGHVNEIRFHPENPIEIPGWSVTKAEDKLIGLTRGETSGSRDGLNKAAKYLHAKTGHDAIVVRSPDGDIVGMIPLVDAPISGRLDPINVLKSQDFESLPDNIKAAMIRARRANEKPR